MSFSALFDYPEGGGEEQHEEFVLLPAWSDDHWHTLFGYAEDRRFSAGNVLIHKGDVDRALAIIVSGTVEVDLPTGRRTQTVRLRPGSLLGEIAFFDARPRSADVRAVTDGQLMRLSVENFERLEGRHPDLARDVLFDLGRLLAQRLRHAQALLSA